MGLDGKRFGELHAALLNAFPEPDNLKLFVRIHLGRNIHEIASGDLSNQVYCLVQWADAHHKLNQLVIGARTANPGNPLLQQFAEPMGLSPQTPPRGGLEKILNERLGFADIVAWREALGRVEGCICRVETPTTSGTGFLVADDVVLTNHHVIANVIAGRDSSSEVIVRFDYKVLVTGARAHPGTPFGLHPEQWLLDESSPCVFDEEPDPKSGQPAEDELDYAFLKLEAEAGKGRLGGATDPSVPLRGHIAIASPCPPIDDAMPIFVVQHPAGLPMKVALDHTLEPALVYTHRHRVRYSTNTRRGSSGSPCFNWRWELVAIHHGSDVNKSDPDKPAYNEGIPIERIVALLKKRGKAQILA